MTPFTPYPDPLTGAELQTLREACNLTREELGDLAGVAARTIKHWESGRAGVPADVAALAQRLDATIQQAADQGARAVAQASARQGGTAPADVVLIRYRSADHLRHVEHSRFHASGVR
jgi:transcriptional regulator with XRE-family HTH domain